MSKENTSFDNQTHMSFIIEPKPLRIEFVQEEELTESELRVRHAQRLESIGTLAAGVAHDFNNLLTAILGNTGLALRKTPPGNPVEPYLKEIETASNLAAVLTSQLLTFSRSQNSERKTINLDQTIQAIMKILERIVGNKVKMSARYSNKPAFVYVNSAQIEQVLMNLCVNARDAMPNGGSLSIEMSSIEVNESYRVQHSHIKPGNYAQIKVVDTGTGMDKATQKRIFEPFFTTKDVGKGTGIGLSMVYTILKEHGGHITVSSELEKGTSFNVLLPILSKEVYSVFH